MSHMSGPWRIDGLFDSEVDVVILAADGCTVCVIAPFLENWEPEEIANANLIVAAPELLAALKQTLHDVSYIQGQWQKDARAAIAKAEGVA